MKKSFLVIGLGRFGASTAHTLSHLGHEVLAVDRRGDRVNAVKDSVLRAIQADATDERVTAQLGVRNFDCVVICIGDDIRSSVLATVLCKELGAKRIIAKAQDDLHARLLAKTGADQVVQPEHDGGVRLARSIVSEGVLDSIDLSERCSISEIQAPQSWVGKSLRELDLRQRSGMSVIALRRGADVMANIDPRLPFEAGDCVFLLGDSRKLEDL